MLTVLKAGMMTSVQDGGRMGWQRFGVPVCGAMDPEALAIANILCGNDEAEAKKQEIRDRLAALRMGPFGERRQAAKQRIVERGVN